MSDGESEDEDEDVEGGADACAAMTFTSACAQFDAWAPEEDGDFLAPSDPMKPRAAGAGAGAAAAGESPAAEEIAPGGAALTHGVMRGFGAEAAATERDLQLLRMAAAEQRVHEERVSDLPTQLARLQLLLRGPQHVVSVDA
jgi:hypothetical protein